MASNLEILGLGPRPEQVASQAVLPPTTEPTALERALARFAEKKAMEEAEFRQLQGLGYDYSGREGWVGLMRSMGRL